MNFKITLVTFLLLIVFSPNILANEWFDYLQGNYSAELECLNLQKRTSEKAMVKVKFWREAEVKEEIFGRVEIGYDDYNYDLHIVHGDGSESFTMFIERGEERRALTSKIDPNSLAFKTGRGQQHEYNFIFSKHSDRTNMQFTFREAFFPGRGTKVICDGVVSGR